ncbi:snRNA-activating protein complex subunit 4 [Antennarius striatus]|uniref:snRNA-activating protein complex subunit 4 n=1 Tax=Antennarius striatus TaxID=241820 RepID=UPI0035AE5C73
MSVSQSAERDRLQRQVEELEQSLSLTHTELEQLMTETDGESDDGDTDEESAAGLLAEREKLQKEIQNLENALGSHSPISVSDDDTSSDSSQESELGLSQSVESCLQMNLVYQQVIQDTLDQLELLLAQNHRQQREVESHLSGQIKETSTEKSSSSHQQSGNLFLGRFLKPYFKDKLTGLGPPANPETKEKATRMMGCRDNKKLRVKRWEGWQKTLLINSVSRDGRGKLIQPKLSKVHYLTQKLSSSKQTDKQQLREQIDALERDIEQLRKKNEDEVILNQYEEHDWQKISNIDFEGTREADDIRNFWQNFLHPSVNKSPWGQEEVQQLKEISRRHKERDWEAIATELGTGRTAFLCLQTFQRFASDSLRRGSWTPDEDNQLRELVEKMRIGNFIPYTQMSYFMEGRDPAQLVYRWNQVLDPSLKKGQWTKEEDQLLLRAVSIYGEKDWCQIKKQVPGRHDGACRDRYYDCLKVGIKKTPFDQQERELLRKLVEKHGVGRWAKIAAEIPHRHDAQCLREWKRLNKEKKPRAKKTKKAPRKRKKAQTIMDIKEEEEEEMTEEEEEEEMIEYMDNDEKKDVKPKEEVLREEEEEEEVEEEAEEEKEYTFPSMKEWIPVKEPEPFTFLTFRPVELPSSGVQGPPVRSTILGHRGRSVTIGPPPTLLPCHKQHSSSALLMVTPDQLRRHLSHQAERYANQKVNANKRNQLNNLTARGLECKLLEAVTPWIGNLLIPAKPRLTTADVLREKGEKKALSSTPVFLLLLQTLNVDSAGCKETIEQRSGNKVASPAALPAPYSSTQKPRTIAQILQERRAKEKLQQEEQQKQQRPQRLLLLPQPPLPHLSAAPFQSPGILLQMLPSTFSLPQLTSAPPGGAVTSPPPPQRPTPLSMVPAPLNAASNGLSTQNPPPAVASSPQDVPVCSTATGQRSITPPSQPTPPTSASGSTRYPIRGRMKRLREHQQDVCSGQNVGGADVGGTCSGLNEAGDGVMKEGKRNRKMSMKARALQEATEAKANAKEKTASPSQRKSMTRKTKSPLTNSEPLSAKQAPPTTPACCDTTGPSSQNSALDPPPTNLTISSPFIDHGYAAPSPNQQGSKQRNPKAPANRRYARRVSGTSDEVGGASTDVTRRGKRAHQPNQEDIALQKAAEVEAEAKRRRTSSSSPRRILPRPSELVRQNQPMTLQPGVCVLPGQPTYVMSPAGLVNLSEAPPQSVQETHIQGMTLNVSKHQSVPSPLCPTPALKKETLQFDTALMFLEPPVEVCHWLSGRGGVILPGAQVALPYLPPFASTLNTFSALLAAKKSLTKSSLQLLCKESKPRRPNTTPTPKTTPTSTHTHTDQPTETTKQPADQPDSTADPRPAEKPASSVLSEAEEEDAEEEEYVAAVRHLVAERFSDNPAYKVLKSRFLSCFTMPALLATMQPTAKKTVERRAEEEEVEEEEEEEKEGEEEEELKKIRERVKEKKAERSLLLSGAPANHLPGFNDTDTPTTDQIGPTTNQIGPVQTVDVQ